MTETVQDVNDELWEAECGAEFSDAANKESRYSAALDIGDIVVLDGFRVIRSNRVLFRTVLNDATVGLWRKLDGIREHTLDGLKAWMVTEDGWDISRLGGRNGVFDHHLVDYGQRLQFWVPMPSDVVAGGLMVVCVDVLGRPNLTQGKEYEIVGMNGDLYVVVDDNGERVEFIKERFKECVQ